MKETEIKLQYKVVYREKLLERCLELGFSEVDKVKETDVYYTPSHMNFLISDQALRVRCVSSLSKGEQCLLTYKGRNEELNMQSREELEIKVENGRVMHQILQRLDFSSLATVEKERIYYKKKDMCICVDEVAGLGSYFEVEVLDRANAKSEILALVDKLTIPDTRIEPKTYLELILKDRCKIND